MNYTAYEVDLILRMLSGLAKQAKAAGQTQAVEQAQAAGNDWLRSTAAKQPYRPETLELLSKTIPAFCSGLPEDDPVVKELRQTHQTTMRILNAAP